MECLLTVSTYSDLVVGLTLNQLLLKPDKLEACYLLLLYLINYYFKGENNMISGSMSILIESKKPHTHHSPKLSDPFTEFHKEPTGNKSRNIEGLLTFYSFLNLVLNFFNYT